MKKYYTNEFFAFESDKKVAFVLDSAFIVSCNEKLIKKDIPLIKIYNDKFTIIIQSNELDVLLEKTGLKNHEFVYLSLNKKEKTKNFKMKFTLAV